MPDAYLTGSGAYLPGEPLDHDAIAQRLGSTGTGAALRGRVLAANGIRARELLAAGGVCASGMAALAGAVRAVRLGEQDNAVVVGSELVSRSLRRSRYGGTRAGFDAEFLRWTLSDGAGAVVVEPVPRPDGASLRVDWIHLVSHANRYPVCMSAGGTGSRSWLDLPDATAAERDGMLRLRQDVKLLPSLFRVGLQEFVKLVRLGRIRPSDVDHVLCHYSAEHFRGEIFDLLRGADLMIDERRWYTNLHTRGNTGAASIFVMLEEAWRTGRFQPGDRILLIVPESGRFSFAFAQLTCVAPADTTPHREHATPSPLGEADDGIDGDVVRWTVLELSRVWADFERRVRAAPVVRRIDAGTATLDDYRALLMHLRQQVVEGGRWISRAASSFSVELFELRSAAIRHAAEEHRDFRLLEEDFRAVGGDVEAIRQGRKNLGSEALSAFMFHQAGQPDPVDLLGAMFVIEGLGTALAGQWAHKLREQLGLREDQVRFLRYHGEADDDHFAMLSRLLRSDLVDRRRAERIVRTAEIVARLYAWQLEEVRP